MSGRKSSLFKFPEIGVPLFWPFGFFLDVEEAELDIFRRNIKYLNEIEKTQVKKPEPKWTTKNKILLKLHTMKLRDFSSGRSKAAYTLILAPYAGHTSIIADFSNKQSLVETLLENGVNRICVTDWNSATEDMKNYDIDNYLAELNVAVDGLGGTVNIAGLCQGGWMAAMYAARFPDKVRSLILAGAPIDTDAGKGDIKKFAHKYPMEFYNELVSAGGGVLKGGFMLEGFKNMHPRKQYFDKFVELYEHIDDPKYTKRFEDFERWYEYTINLPGRWYLQVVKELFKENRFYKGEFTGLGKKLNLKSIKCPVYLLAGAGDDITPKEQVLKAEERLGTPEGQVVKDLAPGGHIGLFMGSKPLRENWPKIADWIAKIKD
jgi:poly(3-hydroxybutyrate) depolymerase